MLLSKTLRLFLDSIGRRDEYEFYLNKFHSDDSACFALVCPEPDTVHELLAFDLDFLHRLELHPLTVLCGPEAPAMLEALQATGNAVNVLSWSDAADVEGLIKQMAEPSADGIWVLVDADRSFDELLPLLTPAVARRVHFLRASGALKSPRGPMIPFINPGFEVDSEVVKEDQAMASLCLALLDQRPTVHFSVSSSLDLLKEMFTVKGAGTVIRPGSRLALLEDSTAIDFDRLQELIETSFNKKFKDSASIREASRLIVEEQYRGAALLEQHAAGSYLSKFAVGTEARGEGLALEIWKEVLAQAPALFWRSRAENPINQWYMRQADGMQRVGGWQVFWRGVAVAQVPEVVQYCTERASDFIEPGVGDCFMKKILIGTLVGGLVAHIWGSLVWMVFPIYDSSIKTLPNEPAVMEALTHNGLESGAYFFPAMPADMSDKPAMEAYNAVHEKGPIGFMVYSAEGKPCMPPSVMARGFLFNLMTALSLSLLLAMTALPTYGKRLGLIMLVGAFYIFAGPLMAWNWMYYPLDFTIAGILDRVLASLLLGLVLAGIVKPSTS